MHDMWNGGGSCWMCATLEVGQTFRVQVKRAPKSATANVGGGDYIVDDAARRAEVDVDKWSTW